MLFDSEHLSRDLAGKSVRGGMTSRRRVDPPRSVDSIRMSPSTFLAINNL